MESAIKLIKLQVRTCPPLDDASVCERTIYLNATVVAKIEDLRGEHMLDWSHVCLLAAEAKELELTNGFYTRVSPSQLAQKLLGIE
jgi:hypothetical protein